MYYGVTIRDFVKQDNIAQQKKKFDIRGKFEIEALKSIKHVMGRTEFDYAAVKRINSKVVYHFCPENLRREFIQTERYWKEENCEKFSIFMSQGAYPIKGLHLAIEALNEIKRIYPTVKLYVAGANYFNNSTVLEKIKQSSYSKYINKLIHKYNLEKNIFFVGELNAEQMRESYLKTNVYILPSIIENSPNSLMEALSLGVPSVASDVGGVSSLMIHGKQGFLYPADEYYMLAYYIMKIFENVEEANKMSHEAVKCMKIKNNIQLNIVHLLKIYEEIFTA